MWQQALIFEDVPAEKPISIPGFRLQSDYITPEEEQQLLAHINPGPWETDWRRRIQQYGLGYGDESRGSPTWLRDFPQWLLPLAERVGRDAGFDRFPENCVINEYIPPQGIGPHRDYGAFGDIIACVSLASGIIIDFTNPEQNLRVPTHVPAGSLWVISGEARWKWTHGIAPRYNDMIAGIRRPRGRRISITFRTGKKPPNY